MKVGADWAFVECTHWLLWGLKNIRKFSKADAESCFLPQKFAQKYMRPRDDYGRSGSSWLTTKNW